MAVMDHPLTVVENAYRAWEERDFVEALCALDPEVVWHQEDGLPYAGDYRGRDAVAQLLRDVLSDWGRLEIKPVKWIDEVLQYALTSQPQPSNVAAGAAPATTAPDSTTDKPIRRASRKQVPAH